MQREELRLDRRRLEPAGQQRQRQTGQLPVGQRQHRRIALVARAHRQRGDEQRDPAVGQVERGDRAAAHPRNQPLEQPETAAGLVEALADRAFGRGGVLVARRILVADPGAHHDQRGVEQVSGQFAQRQLAAPLRLAEARLRRKQAHRGRRGVGVARRDQRLHQRRQHRIEPEPRRKPLGQRRLQRQRVGMAEHDRVRRESAGERVAGLFGDGATLGVARRGLDRDDQLERDVAQLRAHRRDDPVAEQRMILVAEQVAQDWLGVCHGRVGDRQFVGEQRQDCRIVGQREGRFDHAMRHIRLRLRRR